MMDGGMITIASYLFLLEFIYKEHHLDFHKQDVHLFVNMQPKSTRNGIMEILSDGAVSWYFSIAKEDKHMKFPLIIIVDTKPMFDLIEKLVIYLAMSYLDMMFWEI